MRGSSAHNRFFPKKWPKINGFPGVISPYLWELFHPVVTGDRAHLVIWGGHCLLKKRHPNWMVNQFLFCVQNRDVNVQNYIPNICVYDIHSPKNEELSREKTLFV